MAPGFNRYALLLALLSAGSISAIGCSSGGGGHGGMFASTAASTSATTGVSTTTTASTTTPQGPGPKIQTAVFEDKTGNNHPSKGDRVRVTFDLAVQWKAQQVDANKEFQLAVSGDTFGAGAVAMADGTQMAVITLGDSPKLKISDTFDPANVQPGAPSGIDVAQAPSGSIVGQVDPSPIRSTGFVDLGGNVKVGFAQGPQLVAARGQCEAVGLDDGRVFVVGGLKAGGYCEDAEVFDPLTNQWTQVRDLSGPDKGRTMDGKNVVRRIQFQATKLQDGRVLVTGGYGYHRKGLFGLGKDKLETLPSAHIFDPKTNTFKKVGDMKHDRHSHTATLLADGRVLIVGGYSDSWWSRKSTEAPFEAFDPKTEKFTQYHHWLILTNKTKQPREEHAAVALDGGARVLLAGGEHWEGGWLHWFGKNVLKMNNSAEVFVSSKNDCTSVGSLHRARRHFHGELLSTNDVLVAGGDDDKGVVGSLETWSPSTNNWTDHGALKFPRTNARIATYGTTETMIIGGFAFSGQQKAEVADVEVYDPVQAQVSAPYKLAQGRNSCAVAKMLDGRIMVIGGFVGTQKNVLGVDGQPLATVEIFDKP